MVYSYKGSLFLAYINSTLILGKATKQELQHDEAGQKIKKFVAEHKFELLEDFQSSAPLTLSSQQNTATCSQLEMQRLEPHCTSSNSDGENWKQQCYCSKIHPIKLMVGTLWLLTWSCYNYYVIVY